MTNWTRRGVLGAGASLAAMSLASRAFAIEYVAENVGTMVSGLGKDGPYRIGFSNGFSGNSWRAMCLAAIKAEAAAHQDVADLIIVDGQGDINKQVSDIESLVTQQVDAILCIPNSGDAVAPALARAMREGIVTVPFNLPVTGERWTTYVGTDPAKKGGALGQWLNDALGGEGKVVALGGLPGNSYTAAAWEGAQAAFASGIEVLTFRDAYWEEDRAKVIMADLIAAYPEIDGVWCDGGQVAAGATKALLDAGRPLVPVTGDDYNGLLKLYDEVKADQPGFDFGVMSEPTWQSAVALDAALTLLRGGEVAQRQVLQPNLITTANYADFIRPSLPDGVFVDTRLTDDELKAIFS